MATPRTEPITVNKQSPNTPRHRRQRSLGTKGEFQNIRRGMPAETTPPPERQSHAILTYPDTHHRYPGAQVATLENVDQDGALNLNSTTLILPEASPRTASLQQTRYYSCPLVTDPHQLDTDNGALLSKTVEWTPEVAKAMRAMAAGRSKETAEERTPTKQPKETRARRQLKVRWGNVTEEKYRTTDAPAKVSPSSSPQLRRKSLNQEKEETPKSNIV